MNYLKDLGNESMEMKSDLFSVVKKYKVQNLIRMPLIYISPF